MEGKIKRKIQAAVLEKKEEIQIREIEIEEEFGENDVRVIPKAVGICGSDVHYYKSGGIGDYIVKEPMILGHEVAGLVTQVGAKVKHLKVGDRVCCEPGRFNRYSSQMKEGMYNLDPSVEFWATPPVHGILCEDFIHPGDFTFKLPESVTMEEGAMMEPLAVAVHSVEKAGIKTGDTALIIGCGPIGILCGLTAEAAGCSKIIISDMKEGNLEIAKDNYGFIGVNSEKEDLEEIIERETEGKGVDVVFEASGNILVYEKIYAYPKQGGTIIIVGTSGGNKAQLDIFLVLQKELVIKGIFRYCNAYPRAINLVSSRKLNLKPLITHHFHFLDTIKAYQYAASNSNHTLKIIIDLP